MRGNLKVLNPFATNETNPLVLSHLKFSNAQHPKLYCAISLQVLNYSQQAFRNPVYRNYLTKYFRTKINRVSNTDARGKINCIFSYISNIRIVLALQYFLMKVLEDITYNFRFSTYLLNADISF